MVGKTVAHYEITDKIGAGAMGEVYRARDTKLGREIALKVLLGSRAHDPRRMARFQTEARVLASLNHPNISSIYGMEEMGDQRILVMELVEGEDLSERIGRGPIPLEEAVPIALQIAQGLEAAHDKGIVHRDLKPANVKITPLGQVKVLDFGLAKAMEEDLPPATTAELPSPSSVTTQEGAIIGTVAYMSPESGKKLPVDRRADIWAFGVVLFEMLSGGSPFSGETVWQTLTHVLKREPEWEKLPEDLPPSIRDLLKRCLNKDTAFRLQAIGEARICLHNFLNDTGDPFQDQSKQKTVTRRRERVLTGLLALVTIVAALVLLTDLDEPATDSDVVRFVMDSPSDLTFRRGDTPVVSPDGKLIALEGMDEDGRFHIWLRRMDSLEVEKLEGTEGAYDAFWSPESDSIGFFAGDKLKRISVDSGVIRTVADGINGWGGTWGSDDSILFTSATSGPLYGVSAAGGQPEPVTRLDSPPAESHDYPFFLPGGRGFLFLARGGEENGIYMGSLDSDETPIVVKGSGNPSFSSNHLLFPQGTSLMVQPFDPSNLKLTGDPYPIAEQVSSWLRKSIYSVSETGTLVYRSGSDSNRMIWRDRAGTHLGTVGEPGGFSQIALSPDETRVAVEADGDIWVLEMASGALTRFTLEPSSEGDAVWSPDGRQLIYQSEGSNLANLYRKSLGGGEGERLFESTEAQYPEDWSSDWRYVVYVSGGARAVYFLDLTAMEPKPTLLSESTFQKDEYHFSPDGKWIAYNSNESGRVEVYVASFPDLRPKRQVSNGGGCQPLWRGDGRELFYLQLDGKLMSVEIETTSGLEPTVPKQLFQTSISPNPLWNQYSVSKDGKRFLVLEREESDQINLVLNCFD